MVRNLECLMRNKATERANQELKQALLELADEKNGAVALLVAVIQFHHQGSVSVPEFLVREIIGTEHESTYTGLQSQAVDGKIHIFTGPGRSIHSLKS